MSELMTISKIPQRSLPYIKEEYTSTLAAFVAEWFYREMCVTLAKKIELALKHPELEEGEAGPSQPAISGIVDVADGVPKALAASAEPEISVFHGEAIVTWKKGDREITLMSRGNADDPKLLRYEAGQDQPSRHHIQTRAAAHDLRQAIVWLNG